MNFETDEDFEEYLEEAATELSTSKQAEVNTAVDSTGKVVRGQKPEQGGKVKPASKEEVASVVSQIM
jgi:hypothetical protein